MEKATTKKQVTRTPDGLPEHGRLRAIIEGVSPEIDCGRYAVKRVIGDEVVVEADIFTDGHDSVAGRLLYRRNDVNTWTEVAFEPLVNDRWRASFRVGDIGRYQYTLLAWVDHLSTWRRDLQKKIDADQHTLTDIKIGVKMIESAASRASAEHRETLNSWARELNQATDLARAAERALDDELYLVALSYPDEEFITRYPKLLDVIVDRKRAEFGSWYELFPRSAGADGAHGTFKDVENLLPYVAGMGFDVLYLPPIHPIGHSFRKGKNNVTDAGPDDSGSPWAIGAAEGGHKSILPELGALEDFRHLVEAAHDHGLELAMDHRLSDVP